MDYEKEYKAALERARKIHDDIVNNEVIGFPGQITDIFPELAESEDERIRKWLYNMVENLGYPADEAAEKELEEMQPLALAWLEKQKERKPVKPDSYKNCNSQWKPSEEQMKALDRALYYVPEEIGIPIAEIYGHFNKMKKKQMKTNRVRY